jgi:hypothetical protein
MGNLYTMNSSGWGGGEGLVKVLQLNFTPLLFYLKNLFFVPFKIQTVK